MLLHLPQMEVVITVDTLVAREALDLVPDHRDLLLQYGKGDVGVALLELVRQVAEFESHLGIPATHLHLCNLAPQMLYRVWESLHLQGLLVPQEAPEPGRQGLNFCQLLFKALGLGLHLLGIFFAPSTLLGILLLKSLLPPQRLLVSSSLL